jgi:predicted AAA+ superfamily ATPase
MEFMVEKYRRWLTENVKLALKSRRVVVIAGARQTGKTTLSSQVIGENGDFRSLDDTDMFKFALSDPKGFVMNKSGTMVIDEIQKIPALIPEIKLAVDKDDRPGQYLLTGSANILTLPTISDSLAGRVKYMRLCPLTQGEILGKNPSFLERAFEKNFPTKITGYNKADIIDLAFRGGYPEAIKINDTAVRKDWYNDYVKAIVDHDLKDIANIHRRDALEDLVKILAAWSTKFMEMSQITAVLSVNKITLGAYINTLIAMFMFEKVSPWLKSDYDRIGKRSKFFATDTGIMTSKLDWNPKEVFMHKDRSGKLMETFVFQELVAQVTLESKYNLYQYRDRIGREIDFIVERSDGALLGVEVKAGHNVSKEDFVSQIWFQDNIIKNRKLYIGLVLYSGDRVINFANNLIAVPIASLWTE